MNETALNRVWDLLGRVLALNSDTFELINTLPHGSIVALLVVLAAGLSQAFAQVIILFINRVKLVRFVFSLLIGAVLFVFGYIFLVFSTWLISFNPFTAHAPFGTVARILGFSYAPLIFSFLGAMPYLGVPILSLLSLWHLLAMVVGLSYVVNVSMWQAFGSVALGWVMLQVSQRTVGQPLAQFGHWLASEVAGVELVTKRQKLLEMAYRRLRSFRSRVTNLTAGSEPLAAIASGNYKTAESHGFRLSRVAKQLLRLLSILFITFAALILLFAPVCDWWFAWYENLTGIFKLVFDLVSVGIIALVVAALLAPLEALGWWAGWYGDQLDTRRNSPDTVQPIPQQRAVTRYVIYLDGVSQTSFKYLPDVSNFIDSLTHFLPQDVLLLKGIISYSVLNKPLTGERPLAFFWRLADQLRLKNPASLFGYLVNIRNVLVVAVAADKRYGPIYNLGIAEVMYKALLKHGYQPSSGVPITLIGFSGGGQMAAGAVPFLKRALNAPIELISLGGVISGNTNVLKLEHLYHLVGDKDTVEPLGSIMFPGRWRIFFLSYWNRAKRLGKISFISLGPVGHQLPGGIMDPNQYLPDGRSFLQQTIDLVSQILSGKLLMAEQSAERKISNYELYQQAEFNHPSYYPLNQSVSSELYQAIAPWMGRLVLPAAEQRQIVRGALFEVHHADAAHQHLVGQVVNLRWSDDPRVQAYVRAVTKDVNFSAEAEYNSKQGAIHPERLNHWQQVDPLESLAGSRPNDDVIVMLHEPVVVEESSSGANIYISCEPVQITGRFYGLVKFLQPVVADAKPPEQFRVVHFNRTSRQFDGVEETVRLPQAIANKNGVFPSTSHSIEKSPVNPMGWYIYGALDRSGMFVVQGLAPRALLQLQPQVIFGKKAAMHYLKKQCWANITAQKGRVSSVQMCPQQQDIQEAIDGWQEGDRALVIHMYGGIGGKKREPATKSPIYFGHFAYGVARVVREPLNDELRFDIEYHQVYTHNTNGLIAGTLHWSRYMGDRQFGWLGIRPVSDILIKLDSFTEDYDVGGVQRSGLMDLSRQLEAMTARYRIGNGTGGTYIEPANNCAQDSNQAMYASIKHLQTFIQSNPDAVQDWLKHHPVQAGRFQQLVQLEKSLKRQLLPFGKPRLDWENNEYNLGISLEDHPLKNLLRGLVSWRTMLPRLASDTIVKIFLERGASVWVLRTNQVGGFDPDIEPVAPTTL
jgi:predicted Abi (CAAX) family protease